MRHIPWRRRLAVLLLAALAGAALLSACGGSMQPSVVVPTVATITAMPTLDEMLSAKTMGSASAPNQIVEYVSFWSSNSAAFHLQVLPQIKSQFVDTGRASVTFRNLSVSGETATAILLPYCAGNAKFFDAVNLIFSRQTSWMANADPDTAVRQVMMGFGMSASLEDQCVANSALQNGLGNVIASALTGTYLLPDGTQRAGTSSSYSIYAVPAVVVNGTLLDGMNADGTSNPAYAPTLANVQALLK